MLFVALAFARPIVASAVGGLEEVGTATGAVRLVPPGDASALAAALAELLADEAQRDRLIEAAGRAARGPYSWDTVAERTLTLYGELLGR